MTDHEQDLLERLDAMVKRLDTLSTRVDELRKLADRMHPHDRTDPRGAL